MTAKRSLGRLGRRIVGKDVYHTYLRPLRHKRRKQPYDAGSFYAARYDVARREGTFTDETAMQPGHSPLRTRYHYNAVENAILEALIPSPPPPGFSLLDVGSGAGHWIAFYRETVGAGPAVGVEISSPAVEGLRTRFASADDVEVVEADISSPEFSLERTFDIVNAVGVLYHVVDDDAWRRAVANLGAQLAPGGQLLIADKLTRITLDAGFHRSDSFSSFEEEREARPDRMLVHKRLRSHHKWRGAIAAAGLELAASVPVRRAGSILTPANRVLVLRRS